MNRVLFGLGGFAAAALLMVSTAVSQPPEGKGGKGKGDKKGPPRYELGQLFPPFVRDQLDLTPEQAKQVAELEATVKRRLEKVLTAEQKQKLQDLRPPMGPGGKGGTPGKGGKGGPGGGKEKERPERPDPAE
jgi:hypothetical protein